MKLRDKFRPFVWFNSNSFNVPQNKEKDENSIKCEQIAEEFAIGFAEWVFKNKGNMELYKITTIDNSYILKSTKELLEIYKKEKGL